MHQPPSPDVGITLRDALLLIGIAAAGFAGGAWGWHALEIAVFPAAIWALTVAVVVFYFLGGVEGNQLHDRDGLTFSYGKLRLDNLGFRLAGGAATFVILGVALWFGFRSDLADSSGPPDIRPEPSRWVALDVGRDTLVTVEVDGQALPAPTREDAERIRWAPRFEDGRLKLYPARGDDRALGSILPAEVLALLPTPVIARSLPAPDEFLHMEPRDGRITHNVVSPGSREPLRRSLTDFPGDYEVVTAERYLRGCRIPFRVHSLDDAREVHRDTLGNKVGSVFHKDHRSFLIFVTEARCHDEEENLLPTGEQWARFAMIELNVSVAGAAD